MFKKLKGTLINFLFEQKAVEQTNENQAKIEQPKKIEILSLNDSLNEDFEEEAKETKQPTVEAQKEDKIEIKPVMVIPAEAVIENPVKKEKEDKEKESKEDKKYTKELKKEDPKKVKNDIKQEDEIIFEKEKQRIINATNLTEEEKEEIIEELYQSFENYESENKE